MSDAPSRKQDQFIVRLPDGMRDRIKAAADANNRSMNAEIVAMIEEQLNKSNKQDGLLQMLRQIAENLDAEKHAVDAKLAEILAAIHAAARGKE